MSKAALTLLAAVALAILLAFSAPPSYAGDKVVICYQSTPSALIPLAGMQGYYAAEGLDAGLRQFSSGPQALDAMFAGECALAAAADIPVAHRSLSRSDFRIIAAISESANFGRIIGRSDRGIRDPANLRGRRVAVAQFTGAHAFLDAYLLAHGLTPKDIEQVFLPAAEVISAFRRGDVDAAAHWEPNVQMLANEFGTRAKVFAAPGLQSLFFLLLARSDYLPEHTAVIERVLRSLMRAERFAKERPANAKMIVAHSFRVTLSEIELLWPSHDYRISLDQSLLFILENAARWVIGVLPPAQRPALPKNYLDYFYFDGLQAVKPQALTIIH